MVDVFEAGFVSSGEFHIPNQHIICIRVTKVFKQHPNLTIISYAFWQATIIKNGLAY